MNSPVKELPVVTSPQGSTLDVSATSGLLPKARRLQKAHAPASFWLQWGLLLLVVVGGYWLAAWPNGGALTSPQRLLVVLGALGVLLLYPRMGVFRRLRRLPASLVSITLAWSLVFGGLIGLTSLIIGRSAFSVPGVLSWFGFVVVGQWALVAGVWWCSRVLQQTRAGRTPVVLVGSGEIAVKLFLAIRNNPYLTEEFVGVVSENEGMALDPRLRREIGDELIVSPMQDLRKLVKEQAVDRIYLALPFESMAEIGAIQEEFGELNVDVVWAPDLTAVHLLNPTLREISGIPLISLSESPLSSIGSAYLKSLFDVVFCGIALLFAAPLMLLAALAVKLTSAGPVFYKQIRHGWDGGEFEIWKFRSMYVHDESDGAVTQACKDDARVTPVGRFLRRTSIDELPQLFNVLNGTMSLVGPRPHAIVHNYDYADRITAYMSRHRIKPGITGLAQISGLRGETETLEKMRRRVEADLSYINNWSIWVDFWILLKTPLSLLLGRSAY